MGKPCQSCGGSRQMCVGTSERGGAAAPDAEEHPGATPETARPGAIEKDATGKYHWYYELSLLNNPAVFITCMKVFGGIVVGMGVFIGLVGGDGFTGKLLLILQFWLYGLAGMFVLAGLSYFIYAAIQGFKYCVVFEMDEHSVTHIQLARQFKKAQVMAGLTFLMGASTGSCSMMGTGLLSGSRNSMETVFKKVRQIKVNRRRNVICLRSGPSHNQIYVQRERFDEVLDYILARIPDSAKRKGLRARRSEPKKLRQATDR